MKVSKLFEEPGTKEVSLIYKATQEEKESTEEFIKDTIDGLVISSVQLSGGVAHLFKSPEMKHPQFSFLQSA